MTSQHLWQWQFLPTKQFIIECKSYSIFDYYAFHNKTIIFNFQWPLVLDALKFWSSNYTNGKKKKANMFFLFHNRINCTALKVSVFGVILVRIFPYLDWIRRDTRYLSVFSPNAGKYFESLRIQSECGKIRTRVTPNTDSFYAVLLND